MTEVFTSVFPYNIRSFSNIKGNPRKINDVFKGWF